jgi:hypothetical protein
MQAVVQWRGRHLPHQQIVARCTSRWGQYGYIVGEDKPSAGRPAADLQYERDCSLETEERWKAAILK